MEKSNKEKQQQQPKNPMSMPPMTRGSDDPWLVFFHGKRGQYQTFYSISQGHNHVKTIPCLRRKYICTYGRGWMVLSGRCSDECFLLNPSTMGKIQLPPLDFQFNKCVLSSAPTDPSCTVLFISCPRDDLIIFRFCSPQESGTAYCWIKKEMTFKDSSGIIDATSCDGKIYALTNRFDEILIIEVVDTTTLTIKKIGIKSWLPSLEESLPFNKVLVESCGELYLVRRIYVDGHKPYEIRDFEVFKLDFSTMSWERVKSLGNLAFFLGPDCCMSCFCFAFPKESESGIMGNTIYFTMAGDKSLYAFNLEEKSINVSLPCPNVQHNWFQPNWVMLPSSGEGFGIKKET